MNIKMQILKNKLPINLLMDNFRNCLTTVFFHPFSSLLLFIFFLSEGTYAQTRLKFNGQRAKENYRSFKDSTNLSLPNAIKYIPLNQQKTSYLSLGGSYRSRFEHFTNRSWITDNNESYYSQRLSFHTDWHVGKYLRFFGELYHGYVSNEQTLFQSDQIDIHQGFVEINIATKNNFTFRFGRQELQLGVGRLVDFRSGTNIRRSFDMGKITFSNDKMHIDAIYGQEVEIGFEAFDNQSNIFDKNGADTKLWGAYGQFKLLPNTDKNYNTEFYYLGFQSDQSAFSDLSGEETRHSIGIRRYGLIPSKRIVFNTELVYQFGTLGEANISAFNFELDYKYIFINSPWKITLGLKLDYSSGDRNIGDNKLQTYNPLFVNPGIYSLAAVNTPVNLNGLHPSIKIYPFKGFSIYMDYAFFFRSSKNDGLYTPPRFQIRDATSASGAHIGNAFGVKILYEISKNLEFSWISTFYIPEGFVEESGESSNIFYMAPTLEFKF